LNIEISDDLKLAVMTLVLFITLKIIAVKCNLSYFSLIHDHTFFLPISTVMSRVT